MVERFNSTIKRTLRKLQQKSSLQWDKCLPFVLWVYRGAVHSSTGFSPHKMLYGRKMRMALDELADCWMDREQCMGTGIVEYLDKLKNKIETIQELATEHETRTKQSQKHYYDQRAKEKSFKEGDLVLAVEPMKQNKLHIEWTGPYPVLKKNSDNTYVLDTGQRRRKIFHVNALKRWTTPTAAVLLLTDESQTLPLGVKDEKPQTTTDKLTNTQREDLQYLKERFSSVISDNPGTTDLITHCIQTGSHSPIYVPPYRLPKADKDLLDKDLKQMLEQGIIQPSTSEWAVSLLYVPKKDGTKRPVVNYWKLNSISKTDPYPLPHIDDLIDNLGKAKFISALDLTKGYWQVPIEGKSREKTAFITPQGKYEFLKMPFGLMGAPSTFQHLMDMEHENLLQPILMTSSFIVLPGMITYITSMPSLLKNAGLTVKESKSSVSS